MPVSPTGETEEAWLGRWSRGFRKGMTCRESHFRRFLVVPPTAHQPGEADEEVQSHQTCGMAARDRCPWNVDKALGWATAGTDHETGCMTSQQVRGMRTRSLCIPRQGSTVAHSDGHAR